jgi:hypothetical protein
MNRLQAAIAKRLPWDGDILPICGHFYRDRIWVGAGPIENLYPRWFWWCCRAEAWIYKTIYRMCGVEL